MGLSKPMFGSRDLFFSIFRDLQELRTFPPPQTQRVRNICSINRWPTVNEVCQIIIESIKLLTKCGPTFTKYPTNVDTLMQRCSGWTSSAGRSRSRRPRRPAPRRPLFRFYADGSEGSSSSCFGAGASASRKATHHHDYGWYPSYSLLRCCKRDNKYPQKVGRLTSST